ncbi:MAG: hypothetical protein HAW63_05620 [Bdellovibrionaceae bacterium]|nr:hypothetical protein [Pseudobdellovibrionaceae bacterium]
MKALFSIFNINLVIILFLLLNLPYKAEANKALTAKKTSLAKKYFKQKQCAKVIAVLNNHINQLDSIWLKKMAYCFKRTNNLQQEKNIYKHLVGKNPKDYFSHFALARLYQKENVKKASQSELTNLAIKHLRLSIKIKATFLPPYNALSKILKKQNNYYDLQNLSENFLKMSKNNKKALANLCLSYFKQDYIEESIIWCKKAIKYNKTSPLPALFVYLSINLEKKKQGSGEKLLFYTGRKFPKSLLVAETLANKYYKENNHNLSSRYYAKVIRFKSKNLNTLEQAIWSFFAVKKYNLGLVALKQLCSLNKREGVHIAKTAISKLETSQEKKWLSPYKVSLAKNCY